jgi:hypothetical protein
LLRNGFPCSCCFPNAMFGKRPGVQLAHWHCETFCLRVITRTADSGQVGGWVMQCVPHVRHHLQNDCTRDICANQHDQVAGSDTRGTRWRRGWRAGALSRDTPNIETVSEFRVQPHHYSQPCSAACPGKRCRKTRAYFRIMGFWMLLQEDS